MSDEVDRLNTALKSCNPSSDKFNSSACASPIEENKAPIKLDPNNPVSGFANAGQQITVIVDQDHRNAAVHNFAKNNLDQFSNAKHLLYEYELPDLEELEAQYPSLKQGETIGDKIAIAEELRELVYSEIEKDPLFELEWYLKMHDILTTPTIDVRDHWKKFRSTHTKDDPKEAEEEAKAVAGTIQQAKDRGMKVHFFNRNPQQKYDDMIADLKEEKRKFMESNEEVTQLLGRWRKEDGYVDLSGLNEQEYASLADQVSAYGDKIFEFNQQMNGLYKKANHIRFGDAALEAEANRILTLTNGENAIVIVGADHLNGSKNKIDLNERLDRKLAQKAYKNGTIDFFVPTKRIDVYATKAAYADDEQLLGKEQDLPDMRYFEAEDEYQITPKGQQNFEFSASSAALELNVQGQPSLPPKI